eukprot:GHVU01118375.1.p4 GENE.GHVU01118375.1~~GHVU01118375.1.p4  ORF type:complete len:109 (-),score=9.96 GHVU01118375.1:174-500(-)
MCVRTSFSHLVVCAPQEEGDDWEAELGVAGGEVPVGGGNGNAAAVGAANVNDGARSSQLAPPSSYSPPGGENGDSIYAVGSCPRRYKFRVGVCLCARVCVCLCACVRV